MVRSTAAFACLVLLLVSGVALGADAYHHVRLAELALEAGELHDPESLVRSGASARPYAVLDGAGEAYLVVLSPWEMSRNAGGSIRERRLLRRAFLAVRAPAGQPLAGRLFWPTAGGEGLAAVRFSLPGEGAADATARAAFHRARLRHYRELLERDIPGAAWFRHQARVSARALGDDADAAGPVFPVPFARPEPESTLDLFSGGRALSENLQLDRLLPPVAAGEETVPLDSIRGITVTEIDWTEIVADLDPPLDPLASSIPADQHAVFFPSVGALSRTLQEIESESNPVLMLLSARNEDSRIIERCERQLGLARTGSDRLAGALLVRSVALTASDPYYAEGTDVAVLFETPSPVILEQALLGRIAVAAMRDPGVRRTEGVIGRLRYRGVLSPDRTVCSYVVRIGPNVVVANSPVQIERLAAVARGETASISSLPEYRFFRDRYRRGHAEEIAFVFLSDATIRRWCGPRWRIAASRRARDAAVMAEVRAANLDRLLQADAPSKEVSTDLPLAFGGGLSIERDDVRSSTLGTAPFLTPIAELRMTRVSKAEAEAYERWRDGYQEDWSWAFDPIGIRLSLSGETLSIDLTVMPLIGGSDYRELISVTRGAEIAPGAGDPHDALCHLVLALNTEAPFLRGIGRSVASSIGSGDPFSWIGGSVAVYLDDGPVWDELKEARTGSGALAIDIEEALNRLPLAIHIEVSSALKLTAFLAAFRVFVEQTAPGMTLWTAHEHNGRPYVRIAPSEEARRSERMLEDLALYYSPSGESLIITFSREVLERALDRRRARLSEDAGDPDTPKADPWPGQSLSLRVRGRFLETLAVLFDEDYRERMQEEAWANLPILNEWRRRYPGEDPVRFHERLWHIRLVDPSGGEFVWNEEFMTMESTHFGHPGRPKTGPGLPQELKRILGADFGITFEEMGLRCRVRLQRSTGD